VCKQQIKKKGKVLWKLKGGHSFKTKMVSLFFINIFVRADPELNVNDKRMPSCHDYCLYEVEYLFLKFILMIQFYPFQIGYISD
jgi:hypothetical protein